MDAIDAALRARDVHALHALAFTSGFGSKRLDCWAVLLGVDLNALAPLDVASAASDSVHRDKSTVDKDVARSLWRFADGRTRKRRRACLRRVLNATFDDDVCYYQGFHDVAEVVLGVCGFERPHVAVALCRALARTRFADATRASFEAVALSLRLVVPLVFAGDAALGAALFAGPDESWELLREPLWALSWVITWFAHDVEDGGALLDLWDRLLAGSALEPCYPLYVAAALVLERRGELLDAAAAADHAAPLHAALARLSRTPADWRAVAGRASALLKATPPPDAIKRVPRGELRAALAPLEVAVRAGDDRARFFSFRRRPAAAAAALLRTTGGRLPPPPPPHHPQHHHRRHRRRRRGGGRDGAVVARPPPRRNGARARSLAAGVLLAGAAATALLGDGGAESFSLWARELVLRLGS